MARTDKPRKEGSGTKKSKVKDVVYRQSLGEKGTIASKTPILPEVNSRAKRKGSKAKSKQPHPAPPDNQFEVCENMLPDTFLPISDIDSFSDFYVDGDQAAKPPVDEFEEIVKSLYLSPLQSLPEQPVEITNATEILHNNEGLPLLQSASSPQSQRPLPKSLLASSAPQLQASPLGTLQPVPVITPPPLPVPISSPPTSLQRLSQSMGCGARSQCLPAFDMFHLREPTAPASSAPALTSSTIASAQVIPPVPPPPAWPTQRAVVHSVSPSSPPVFERVPHQARNLQFNPSTSLVNRPLPQPLPPSTHLLSQPQNLIERLQKGSRVTVTKGMHEGRRGIVRGVYRAGKNGPLQYGLWSVMLDGKDIVALSDEYLTLLR